MQSVIINGTNLEIKEFKGRRVISFRDVDAVHKRPRGTARNAFSRNRKHFIEGKDYFLPKGWTEPCEVVQGDVRETYMGLEKLVPNLASPKGITLLTESGYLMLVKVFDDALAWAIQRELVNCYFKVHRPETPPLFTSQAIVPAERTIVSKGKLVVDTPRNQEAQRLMMEIQSAVTALPVILRLFNRYQSEENAKNYKKVICDLGAEIDHLCRDVGATKLGLIEEPK